MASIGLPQSEASPPMLISQGQEEPLQCFSFEGGLEIQQQEPCCIGAKEKNTLNQYHYFYLFAKIIEASYRGVSGQTTKDRYVCLM